MSGGNLADSFLRAIFANTGRPAVGWGDRVIHRHEPGMAPPLSIAVAQPRCAAHDVTANAVAHAEAIRAAGARVVVFPEMSLTGYELDAAPVAPDDQRLAPIVAACTETRTLALVGAPVPGPRIGILAVDGDGPRVVYGKVYLASTEAVRFVPGEPALIEVDGWRLGLAICRDIGVPEHAAKTVALGIDGYVAGIVHADHEADGHGQRARRVAADHGVWVAIAAFAGPTGGGFHRTSGRSAIWSADGELIGQASEAPDDIARAIFP
jgi:predicted amidohydrolase